jgi:hypothetical protein
MKTLKISENNNLVVVNTLPFQNNLGWSESFSEYENEMLETVTNDPENYETVRYIHEPYSGITNNTDITQTDIWFYFYFISGNKYVQNYEATDLSNSENASLLSQATQSFFRLEFYKTTNNESPDRINRKLVFAKNLVFTSGEKFYNTKISDYVYVPVFTGSNYRNKENMYIFWFQDTSPYDETAYTGNTFWVTAKYYNAKDGSILDFTNKCLSTTTEIIETDDIYYQMDIDMNNYSYKIYEYDGIKGDRVGTRQNPIKFYEKGGATC